jgi:hypothetical protein
MQPPRLSFLLAKLNPLLLVKEESYKKINVKNSFPNLGKVDLNTLKVFKDGRVKTLNIFSICSPPSFRHSSLKGGKLFSF